MTARRCRLVEARSIGVALRKSFVRRVTGVCAAITNVLIAHAQTCCSGPRHMFEEKREAVMAIEAAVLPLMPIPKALAA
jgi:hypothetical protein